MSSSINNLRTMTFDGIIVGGGGAGMRAGLQLAQLNFEMVVEPRHKSIVSEVYFMECAFSSLAAAIKSFRKYAPAHVIKCILEAQQVRGPSLLRGTPLVARRLRRRQATESTRTHFHADD